MTSQYWDAGQAREYHEFRYHFPEQSLAGKTVVVAGGSGGLGAATVALLAREGAHLVVGYRANRERAEALRAAMESSFGSTVSLVAGETLLASVESNYLGPILLAKELGAAMESSAEGGSVVLLATMQALAVFPSSLNYAAAKAALVHAARILAQQWNQVRVNVVAPGATSVGMAAASVQSGKYDRHVASGAVARFGRPEDVARAVRFFLEPDNYVTGQVVAVDGGLTLRRDRA
jgi:NAD(P)-dependent dehydrogenase (short-subunit alcohol dehydrogenase family)